MIDRFPYYGYPRSYFVDSLSDTEVEQLRKNYLDRLENNLTKANEAVKDEVVRLNAQWRNSK